MQVSFGYSHYLKTYYLQGKLPTVKKGLYGGELTPETVSLEHILPKQRGGHTTLSNLALATKINNSYRGSKPLKEVLTPEQAQEYLSQFEGVQVDDFSGDVYIKKAGATINRLLK